MANFPITPVPADSPPIPGTAGYALDVIKPGVLKAIDALRVDIATLLAARDAVRDRPSLVPGYIGGTPADNAVLLPLQVAIVQKSAQADALVTYLHLLENWAMNDPVYRSLGITPKPMPKAPGA